MSSHGRPVQAGTSLVGFDDITSDVTHDVIHDVISEQSSQCSAVQVLASCASSHTDTMPRLRAGHRIVAD